MTFTQEQIYTPPTPPPHYSGGIKNKTGLFNDDGTAVWSSGLPLEHLTCNQEIAGFSPDKTFLTYLSFLQQRTLSTRLKSNTCVTIKLK